MHDPQPELAFDVNIAGQEQIEMFRHRSGERILDRDHRGRDGSALQSVEHFCRTSARNNLAAANHALGSFVTERAGFSLNGNFHGNRSYLSEASRRQIFSHLERVQGVVVIARHRLFHEISMALIKHQGTLVVDCGFEYDHFASGCVQTALGFFQ